MTKWLLAVCITVIFCTIGRIAVAEHTSDVGTTRIAAWKGDKTAAFRMAFDDCAEYVRNITPGKSPGLLSFAIPGVGDGRWKIAPAEFNQILTKHSLISRGDFVGHGAMFHQSAAADMLWLADKALASGGAEHIVFHGVDAEYFRVPPADVHGISGRLGSQTRSPLDYRSHFPA